MVARIVRRIQRCSASSFSRLKTLWSSRRKFDAQKFLAINHEHLKSERLVSDEEYAERLLPFLEARGLVVDTASVARALHTIREPARTFVDAAEMLDFFFRPEPVIDPKAASKFLTEDAATKLVRLRGALSMCSAWTEAEIEARVNSYLAPSGREMKEVAQPARVALTARSASPGLYQVMFVLGRDVSIQRLDRGVSLLEKIAPRDPGHRRPPDRSA